METMEEKTGTGELGIENIFRCMECGGALEASGVEQLECEKCGWTCARMGNVWRFVSSESYASSFGYQWKKFSGVQLDSRNGTDFSESRFREITGWGPEELGGKRVLDVGCGAGRFTEIALKYGAQVVSMDLSEAVEACRENHSSGELTVCQASIYEMPFAEGSFDFVFCIGVVQHTPDPEASIRAIARMVKPGGQIGLWIYERDWKAYLGTVGFKYLLRPWTRRLNRDGHLAFTRRIVDAFLPVACWGRDKGLAGKIVMRLLPISSAHLAGIALGEEDFRQWVFLDTFDMYSPAHDHPQTYAGVAELLKDCGFREVTRMPHGGISIVGVKN